MLSYLRYHYFWIKNVIINKIMGFIVYAHMLLDIFLYLGECINNKTQNFYWFTRFPSKLMIKQIIDTVHSQFKLYHSWVCRWNTLFLHSWVLLSSDDMFPFSKIRHWHPYRDNFIVSWRNHEPFGRSKNYWFSPLVKL